MYAIIDKNRNRYVASFSFGEMGWRVNLVKNKKVAKQYKTMLGASNARRKLGAEYEVVTI